MSSVAPEPPIPRMADWTVLLAVTGGVALTIAGACEVDPNTWRLTEHVRWFAGLWAFAALLMWWRGGSAIAAAGLMTTLAGAATGNLTPLAATAAIAWSATVLGGRLLRRWPGAHPLEALVLGLVVLGTLVGLLVHLPINYPGVYLLLLAAPLAWDRAAARHTLGLAKDAMRGSATTGIVERAASSAAVALFGVHLLVAMMPEAGYDALVTHLLLPARIAWDHFWHFDVDRNVWAVMPMLGDWLYTLGYVLAGETGARFVNLGAIVVLAGLVHVLVRWAGGDRRGAAVAVLLFFATPLTLTESSSLFIESVWSCCVVGGALAVFRAASRPSDGADHAPRHLVTAGALLGGAMAAKAVTMTTLPVLALVLACGWRRWLRRTDRGAMAAGAMAFVAVGGVPYLRAWLLTGNPVFPFFNAFFRSPHYPPENFAPPPQFEVGTSWDVLYRITFETARYLEARAGAAGFHWLLLVVPIALLFVLTRHRRGGLLFAVAIAITWLTFRQTAYLRYVFPSFALVAAGVGAGIGRAAPLGVAASRGLGLVTVAALLLDLTCFASGSYNASLSWRVLSSDQARAAFLADRRPLRAAVDAVNALNTNATPVAFFCAPFGTGLHAEGLWANWYNPTFSTAALAAKTPADLAQLLRREGACYLLLAADWRDDARRELVRAVADEVLAIGNVSVRRLREEFRFRDELLQAPHFEDASGWRVQDGAVVEAGVGARVAADGFAAQHVAVVAGREYRLEAQVRRDDVARTATVRLQVQWLDRRERVLLTSSQDVACTAAAQLHSIDVVAPAGAVAAIVAARSPGGAAAFVESLSFRN